MSLPFFFFVIFKILEIESEVSTTSLKEILWKYYAKIYPKTSLIRLQEKHWHAHSVSLAWTKHKQHDIIIQYCKLFHVLWSSKKKKTHWWLDIILLVSFAWRSRSIELKFRQWASWSLVLFMAKICRANGQNLFF